MESNPNKVDAAANATSKVNQDVTEAASKPLVGTPPALDGTLQPEETDPDALRELSEFEFVEPEDGSAPPMSLGPLHCS